MVKKRVPAPDFDKKDSTQMLACRPAILTEIAGDGSQGAVPVRHRMSSAGKGAPADGSQTDMVEQLSIEKAVLSKKSIGLYFSSSI